MTEDARLQAAMDEDRRVTAALLAEDFADRRIPGWEGSVGPFPWQYSQPHVYARNINSGVGNCVCGAALGDSRHVQAAPGVPVPDRLRP